MNKGILIKAGIILGFFAVSLGLAFGCSSIKDNETTPEISNRENAYLTVGDITITNQDLWETMKISDGLNYLLQYAEEILLADVMANDITDADIDEAILELKWGTSDADTIAEIKEDPEVEQDFIDNYTEYLKLLGIDPSDEEALKDFVKLTVAKRIVTIAAINDAADEDPLKIAEEKVQEYYEAIEKGSVCVLDIKFDSEAEANSVLDKFNLVPNYNNGWGKYIGTDPIDTVLTSDFTEANTTQMTDDEVFAAFIELYNFMNPSDTPIPTSTTQADFCDDYSDLAVKDWSDMFDDKDWDGIVNGTAGATTFYTYNLYLFDKLGFEDEEYNYSFSLQSASPFTMLSFKVSETAPTAYADLTDAEKAELQAELTYNQLFNTSDNTTYANAYEIAMKPYWDENPLEIFDPLLKLQYENTQGVTYDNNGSTTVIATVGDEEITADELFAYMEKNVGSFTSIELVKNAYLLQSQFYLDVYGDDYDYLNSDNETMAEHRENLRNMKAQFSGNQYAAYGFDSSKISWAEFLTLAFGAYNEADLIENLYIVGALSYNITDVDGINYEDAKVVIENKVEEYLSLQVDHLLFYLDQDNDFAPDEFKDIVDGLTGDDLTEYNALAVAFETLVLSKVNTDEMTFDEIVKEYNETLIDDDTSEWAQFKEYGFHMLTQELGFPQQDGSLDRELTFDKVDGYYNEDFNTALKRVYDAYVVADDNSTEELEDYLDNQIVKSDSGLHLILAYKGEGFEQPSAKFEFDTDTEGKYSEGSEGTTMAPNKEQVELYIAIKVAEATNQTTDEQLPSSVYDAVEQYYGNVFSAFYSSDYYTISMIDYLLDNNVTFTTDSADKVAYLTDVVEVLEGRVFPEDFGATE